jgi:hypothetical protein
VSKDVILNDQMLVITLQDIMPVIERRVAVEVLSCLKLYATANYGNYPWTAYPNNYADFADHANTRFGRVPDTFAETAASNAAMSASWAPGCTLTGTGWWTNWKELVFIAVAEGYGPDSTFVGCIACLTVNPPTAAPDKQIAVIVSGRILTGQTHAPTATPGNYLEAPNSNGGIVFAQAQSTTLFNDVVVFFP